MKAIKREDLSLIDFSDITGRGRLLDIHPGEILNEDFLGPLGVSCKWGQTRFIYVIYGV